MKDHFLPTMFVDYRKSVQQAISSKSYELFYFLLVIFVCILSYTCKPCYISHRMLSGKITDSVCIVIPVVVDNAHAVSACLTQLNCTCYCVDVPWKTNPLII